MGERRSGRRMARTALLIPIAGLIVLGGGGAGAQGDGVDFVVEPAPGSQTPAGGGYFDIQTNPGDTVTQAIGLRNDGDESLELRLDAVDAATGSLGGASYGSSDSEPTRTGSWISLERDGITLAPDESAIVRFDVRVPTEAVSGVHLAGLSVAPPRADRRSGEAGAGEAGASIDVQTRRVVAVQVNLPGPSDPELVVTGVAAVARPDGLYVEIGIDNRGRGLTKGDGTIRLSDDQFERDFQIDTFVPGTSIAYPVKWTTGPEDGTHQAQVELRYGDRATTWEGSFHVGDDVRRAQADRQIEPAAEPGDDPGGALPVSSGVVLAAAGAAVVVGGSLLFRRLRRPLGSHGVRR